MNRYTFSIYSNCTDSEREAEFNSWYSYTHIPDLSAAKGLTSARRYINLDSESRTRYLATYEFATESIQKSLISFFQLVRRAFETGRHIDCIESIKVINTPFVSCFKEIDPKSIRQLPSREYPRIVPEALEKVEEYVKSFHN
jgi:hypothetical protein